MLCFRAPEFQIMLVGGQLGDMVASELPYWQVILEPTPRGDSSGGELCCMLA